MTAHGGEGCFKKEYRGPESTREKHPEALASINEKKELGARPSMLTVEAGGSL